jgi:hypothetical protein
MSNDKRNPNARASKAQDPRMSADEWDERNGRQVHPAAYVFPTMSDEQRAIARESLNEHGQKEPIRLLDNQVLVNRDAYDICRELRITPWFEDYAEGFEGDPLDEILARIFQRKNWMPAELAVVAASLVTTEKTGGHPGSGAWRRPELTIAEAAKKFRINEDQIKTARTVINRALPEIMKAIHDGKIKTIGHAYSIVTPDKDEKREGLTSHQKQRNWLNDPKNGIKKPEPPPQEQRRLITNRMIAELSEAEILALLPKFTRRLSHDAFVHYVDTEIQPRYDNITARSPSRKKES